MIMSANISESFPQALFSALFSKNHYSPLIIYDSVATVPARANQIKNFTLFQQDVKDNALPQWIFITPNMSKGPVPFVTFSP